MELLHSDDLSQDSDETKRVEFEKALPFLVKISEYSGVGPQQIIDIERIVVNLAL